jgi:hypothetical protein
LSEAGGYQRHVLVSPANGYWQAAPNHYPVAARVRLLDLWPEEGGLNGLICAEVSIDVGGGSVWDDHGVAFYQDDGNFSGCAIVAAGGPHGGRSRAWNAVADAFTEGALTAPGAFAPIYFRAYHNRHASVSFVTVNGDSLAPGQIRCYVSRDSGATWTAIAAAEALATSPDYVQLFCRTTQPGVSLDIHFLHVEITRTLERQPSTRQRKMLIDLYPPGAYPGETDRNGDATFHSDVCSCDADVLLSGQTAVEQLELEIFPQTAEETLDEWEAALQIDTALTAVADRQGLAAGAARSPLLVTPKNLRAMLAELLQSVYGFWDPGTFDVLAHYDVQHGLGLVTEGTSGLVAEGGSPAALVWPGDDAHVSNRLVDRDDGFTLEAELQLATINAATATGLFLSPGPGGSGHGLFLGQEHFGGSAAIRALLYDADSGNWSSLGSIATVGPPCWYRIVRAGSLYHLRAGASLGALADVAVNVELPWRPRVWGVGSRSGGNTVSGLWQDIRIAYSLLRNNVELHEYRADQIPADDPARIFWAFVHRDPNDGGAYDLAGAQRICDRVKWGHSLIIVGESDCFRCDDPFSLTERDILGA